MGINPARSPRGQAWGFAIGTVLARFVCVLLGHCHLGLHAMINPPVHAHSQSGAPAEPAGRSLYLCDGPELPLHGNQSLCRACGQYFKSVFAFEKHRTGTFRPFTRRCRTPEEMLALGMARRGAYWISSERSFSFGDCPAGDPNEKPPEVEDHPGVLTS